MANEQTVIVNNTPTVVQIVAPNTGNEITASDVSVVDAGGYYVGTNVETVLQEVGAIDVAQDGLISDNATAIGTKFDTAGRALNSTGTTINVDADFTSTQYDSSYQTLTFGATVAWDMSAGQCAKLTLTGDALISNPTNVLSITPILEVLQDGTGAHALTFDTDFAEVDIASVTTDANSVTVYAFIKGSDGSFRGQGKTFSL